MNSDTSAAEQQLVRTLKGMGELRETGWEFLFDQSDKLVDWSLDELGNVPEHRHPRHEFYRDYVTRFGATEKDTFVSEELSVPAVSDERVVAEFSSFGLTGRLARFRVLGDSATYRLDPANVCVGIVTDGGNAPGYNTVIDSIVKRHSLLATPAVAGPPVKRDGTNKGLRVLGFEDGFAGLGKRRPVELDVHTTDKASSRSGSALGLGEPGFDLARSESALQAVGRHQLDILYVVGDRNAILAAERACQVLTDARGQAGQRIRVVAAPVTIENDLAFMDASIGFQTAVTDAVEFIQRVHSEAETCRNLAVVELADVRSGSLALHAASASGEVDYVLLPEMLTSNDDKRRREIERAIKLLIRRSRSKGHAIAVLSTPRNSDGSNVPGEAQDPRATLNEFVDMLRSQLAGESLPVTVGARQVVVRQAHTVGCGAPSAFDINLAKLTGKLMVDAALRGLSRCVVSQWRAQPVAVPMRLSATRVKAVDLRSYYARTMLEKYLLTPIPQVSVSEHPDTVDAQFDSLG